MDRTEKLLDICDFQGGTQPPKEEWISEPRAGYVRMLQIRDYTQGDEKFIEYVLDNGKLHKCNADDIMLSRYGYIGQAFTGLAGAYNVALVKVIKKKQINTQYLLYYFRSKYFQRHLLENVGARATIPGFNKTELKNALISIPDDSRQKYIADTLDRIEGIMQVRKIELQTLDDLIKARFVELFGDPLLGTEKWSIHTVGDVADSVDPQPSHRTPPIDENGIPYVSIKDCDYQTGIIDFEHARKVGRNVLKEHLQRYELHDGDFIIGKIGTIGNPIFVPARKDYTLSANIVLIQPDCKKVSPYFLKYSFMSAYMEKQFETAKNSTSQAAFGIQKVRSIKVMNPPIDIQYQFEDFAKRIDKTKTSVQKALDEAQFLFDSLMQKYFG